MTDAGPPSAFPVTAGESGKLDEMGACGMLAVERGLGKVGITVDEHADWAGRI